MHCDIFAEEVVLNVRLEGELFRMIAKAESSEDVLKHFLPRVAHHSYWHRKMQRPGRARMRKYPK